MTKTTHLYPQRRRLRALERGWTGLERAVSRLTATLESTRPYNPFYHLGMLAIFLLCVLVGTGVYLTLAYRPGIEGAYDSVAAISGTWYGSIVRSVHRYSSDALIVVVLLHALKMLLSDRFWGSRWLAWVSGWGMVALFWLIGTMGYFLVWDDAAQWLTEYALNMLGGSFALSFLGPQAPARTYTFFVIVLFLHLFLPLFMAISVLIHAMRLQRPRYWAPRWLMLTVTAVLIALSVAWPVVSGLPADLRSLVGTPRLDWWYMGFLPLSAALGRPIFWGASLAVIALAVGLPWLARGRHNGPSMIRQDLCTGCGTCARECPYNAIEMVQRADDSPYKVLAVVKPHLCTGCGVCVAACPEEAIELAALPAAVPDLDVRSALAAAQSPGKAPTLVYTCDRHAALGSLPPLAGAVPFGRPAGPGLPPRVQAGAWRDPAGEAQPVVTCELPCMGSLRAGAPAAALERGAGRVLLVACPPQDCRNREGVLWLEDRRRRRKGPENAVVTLLEAAPGSRSEVSAAWRAGLAEGPVPVAVPAGLRGPFGAPLAVSVLVVGVLVTLAALPNLPAANTQPAQGQVRLAIGHRGRLMASTKTLPPEVAARLPAGANAAAVLGGERFPVQMRLTVDGQGVLERSYRPAGLRREGSVTALETWWLAPGSHDLLVELMDDGLAWRPVFAGRVDIAPGESLVLAYDEERGMFLPWQ